MSVLTFTTLWANSENDKLVILFFYYFPRKQDLTFHASMKCQILFPGENMKKYFKMSSAENFTQGAKR